MDGVLFEQECARARESPRPEAFLAELDAFFETVPDVLDGHRVQTHVEIRSPHLLTPPYFAVPIQRMQVSMSLPRQGEPFASLGRSGAFVEAVAAARGPLH